MNTSEAGNAARPSGAPWLLIGIAVVFALMLAAAGGGLLVWSLWPRSAPPLSTEPPPAASSEETKPTPQGPSPEEVKAQQELQAARRRTVKNLKELAIALDNYYRTFQQYPPAMLLGPPPGGRGKPNHLLSWRVLLLPFLGEDKLYHEFKFDEPWDGPHNKKLLARMPKVYAPVRGTTPEPYGTYYQVFVGEDTPFLPPAYLQVPLPGAIGPPTRGWHILGERNTLLIVEAGEPVPWTKPADLEYDAKKPLPRLGGLSPDGFHATTFYADVYFIPRDFPEKDLRALVRRDNLQEIVSELKPLSDKDEAPAAAANPKPGEPSPKGEGPLIRGKTVEVWLKQMNSPWPAPRFAAVKALMGGAWLKQFNSPDAAARREAFKAFREVIAQAWKGRGTSSLSPDALRAVCWLTMDCDATLSREALQSVGVIGPRANETMIALLRPSGSHPGDDWDIFQTTAEALARRGGEVAPALLEALNHDDYEVRARAASILFEVNMRNRVRVLDDRGLEDERPKYEAIDKALTERRDRLDQFIDLKPNSPEAADRVLTLLEAQHEKPKRQRIPEEVRARAIRALVQVGPLGRVAIPDLFRPNPRSAILISAKMAAGKIDREPFAERDRFFVGGGSTAKLLARMLHPEPDDPIRSALAEGRFDPAAKGAVATVRKLLQEANGDFRWEAALKRHAIIRALAEAGPAARETVPDLQRLLKELRALPPDSRKLSPGVRDILSLAIADALLRIDPGSRAVVLPVLKDYLRSRGSVFAFEAARLLAGQNLVDRETVEVLLDFYHMEPRGVEENYWAASRTRFEQQLSQLSQLNPQAQKTFVEAGRPTLQSTDVKKRRAAAWILAPLDPDACLPVLLAHLKEGGGDMSRTEWILGSLGPKAKVAFAPLCARLGGRKTNLFSSELKVLVAALVRIDPEAAVPVLWKKWREMEDGYELRAIVFDELKRLGPRVQMAIPTLLTDLQCPENIHFPKLLLPDKSWDAAQLLVHIGPAAVPALQELAGHTKATSRMRAAVVLGQMKAEARPAIPALLKLLADSEAKVRREAVDALREIDPGNKKVAAALLALHKDKDVEVRRRLVRALGGAGPSATPALTAVLADADGDVRIGAAGSLGRLGAPALSSLRQAARHKDVQVRRVAVLALGNLGPDTPGAIAALIEATRDSDPLTRRLAVSLLDRPGRETAAVVPVLVRALSDEDPAVRWTAAFVLEEMGANAAEAVPALTRALADRETDVRRRALFALRIAGPRAASAIPAIQKLMLEREDQEAWGMGHDLTLDAAATLLRVASDPGPLFAEVLQSSGAGRDAAAAALVHIGRPSVPTLMKLTDARDVNVRVQAIRCLGEIGQCPEKTVPLLVGLLQDNHILVRREAASALGALGPKAKEAIGPLSKIAADPQDLARDPAARALQRIAPKP